MLLKGKGKKSLTALKAPVPISTVGALRAVAEEIIGFDMASKIITLLEEHARKYYQTQPKVREAATDEAERMTAERLSSNPQPPPRPQGGQDAD